MLSQHIKCIRPISLECAITYAVTLNKPLSAISPRLAEVIDRLPKPKDYQSGQTAQKLCAAKNIAKFYKPDDQPLIQEITEIAKTMSRDGQLILLGRIQELAKLYPAELKTGEVISMTEWRMKMLNAKDTLLN